MRILQRKTKKVISVSLLLILSISSILMLFPLNPTVSENFNNNRNDGESEGLIPLVSQIGEDIWWNASYRWRQCINITNPGTYNLVDNVIKIQFNWKNLFDSGHMQGNLDDIRIVENGMLRNYFIKQDFPSADQATVWFETNSTADSKQYDTYMYYGNASVGRADNYYMGNCPDGIARWEFEEGSGNMAYDSISDLYHGTFVNMDDTNYIQGVQGDYALDFNGANEFIALNMSFNYGGGDEFALTTIPGPINEFTASAWVKIGVNLGGWSILDFDRSEYFTFAAGTPGYRATDGHVEFDTSNLAGNINDFTGNTLIDEDIPAAWHHCVVTFDSSQLFDKRIFVDGAFDAQVDAWSGLAIDDTVTRFGFIGDGSEASTFNGGRNNHYFQGALDDVRYFDYALTDKEIEWLANYYPLDLNLLGEVERAATVTILVKGVDDRVVSGAEVSLWKNLTHILKVDSTDYTFDTQSDGTAVFANVPFGTYNITVNYTLTSGLLEEIVYDSRNIPGEEVDYFGLIVSTNITANLWTINFEIDDWDGDPLNYGYVEIGNSTIDVLDTLTLDSAGEATFRWINYTSYNYTIYYDNPDYTTHPTPLNKSTVTYSGPGDYTESVTTAMSKLDIRVMDSTGTESVTGVTVKVQLNGTSNDVVELETDTTGYAYGPHTKDFGFWYKTEQVYNFTLWIVNLQQTFIVNVSDEWDDFGLTLEHNYTLDGAAYLEFLLDLDFTQRIANFTNAQGDSSVTWGEDMTFSLTYETSDDGGTNWYPDWNRGGFDTNATWTIYTKYGAELLSQPMNQGSTTGSFTLTINSNLFSAGYLSEFYYVLLSGYKPFWNDPDDHYFGITIYAKSTGMTLHNYTSMPDELPKNAGGDYEISEYYGFTISITARYFDNDTSSALPAESFTFDWDYGSGALAPGPLAGYYTFSIDTSDATNVGKYRIDLTANYENYTKIENFGIYLNIISRPTMINGSSGLFYVSEEIFIFEALNFTFDYIDEFTGNPIPTLDEMSFLLQKIDEDGDPIPETTEMGSLVETIDNKFVLDLDTETRLDGKYSIIVTLDKLNYDHRIAIISLTILKREIRISWSSEFVASKIKIGSGASLIFTVTLTDPNNNSAPITGANAYLTFKGEDYYFNEIGNGNYQINIRKIADAFFMPETFTATVTIEKQYFSTKTESITIVVNMQEIFGFPMFYFLMIVGSIVAVVGSLATYRIVQQRRIPTFVKKARAMKKSIKGKKGISDSLLYPSKEEYLVKKLGDKWESIGLSLGDIIGVKEKMKKKLPEVEKEFKGGAA